MGSLLTALLLWSVPQDAREGDRFVRWGRGPEVAETIVLRVPRIVPVASKPIENGVIVLAGGKITALGRAGEVKIPENAVVRTFEHGVAFPGFVDLHNHIAGGDLNDMVYQVNPELRTLDNVIPENPRVKRALAGGVTTVLFIPGSGTNMGGVGTLVKMHGKTLEEALLRFPGALKIAQAGNPERRGGDLGSGRMGMNWILRTTLQEAKRYHQRWSKFESGLSTTKPELIPRLEQLRGLVAGEFPIAVHTQIFQVVQSTWRILHDELGFKVVLNHSTFDGFKNAPMVAERGMFTVCGPRTFYFDRSKSKIWGVAAAWHEGGVNKIGINTDSPVVPQEELLTQVAVAVHLGLPDDVALRAVTTVPAQAMMIDHRVGSLVVGKDADVVVWTGDPFDVRSYVLLTIVNGQIAYDPKRDGRRF